MNESRSVSNLHGSLSVLVDVDCSVVIPFSLCSLPRRKWTPIGSEALPSTPRHEGDWRAATGGSPLAQAAAAFWSVSPLHPKRPDPKFSRRLSVAKPDKKPQNFLLSLVHLESLSIYHHHHSPLVIVATCALGTTPLNSFLLVSFLPSPQPSTSSIAMASAAPSTGSTKVDAVVQKAAASAPGQLTGLQLYSRFAFAGAVCCSITHGALTPVDVYVDSP